ncbi:MAG: hypothetical protein AAF488_10550 [Planctomycetota bacterium]
MFSHSEVKAELAKFVVVKTDPNSPTEPLALAYKQTRYVPELLVLKADGSISQVVELGGLTSPANAVSTLSSAANQAAD